MKALLRGIILVNFLYLAFFYILYFLIVPMVLYMREAIGTNDILAPYYALIPAATTNMMDFMIFVLVPLIAFGFTLMASMGTPQNTG